METNGLNSLFSNYWHLMTDNSTRFQPDDNFSNPGTEKGSSLIHEAGILTAVDAKEIIQELKSTSKMLQALHKSLKKGSSGK